MRAILAMLGLMLAALAFAMLVMTMPAIDAGFYDPDPAPIDEEQAASPAPRGLGPRLAPDETLVLDAPAAR